MNTPRNLFDEYISYCPQVYDIKPQHLIDQEREMLEHIAKYPDKYNHGH